MDPVTSRPQLRAVEQWLRQGAVNPHQHQASILLRDKARQSLLKLRGLRRPKGA